MTEDVKVGQETIHIKIVDSDQQEVVFKVRRNTAMSKIFTAYASRKSADIRTLRFSYEGTPLTGDNTANDLNMPDDPTIEVSREQVGGSY